MSSELSLFNEFNSPVEVPTQTVFDWDATFAETKQLVEEDAELTATIDDAMVKRFHGRVKIGFNLMELQADHSRKGGGKGDFTTVVLPGLGIMDRKFSHRCISVARLFQSMNVPHGEHSDFFNNPLPIRTWETLASPSTDPVIIDQVMSGKIEATPQAIKEANERAKRAEQERDDTQKELDLFKENTKRREQNREQIHVSQILAATEAENQAKQERDEAAKKLKDMQEKTANGTLSQEAKEHIDALEIELDERTKQRDNLSKLREKLSKELDEQRNANKARQEQELYEHRINDRVKKTTEEWGKCSVTLLGQLPSPIESQVVTGNNWALLDHAADMAQKIIDAVRQSRTSKDSAFLDSEVESNAH